MQKLFKRRPSEDVIGKQRKDSIDPNGPVQFSTMDFFDRFVRPASEKGLLRTPLPTPITKQHVRQCSIQLLQAARLPPEEVRILDDNYGGTIIVSKQGLSQVMGYLQYRQETKAAIVIQKTFRGYAVRKRIAAAGNVSAPRDRNSFVNTEDQIAYLDSYISQISSLYHTILTAHRSTSSVNSPSKDEMEFMKRLNSQETYRVCLEYLHLIAEKEMKPQLAKQRMTILPGSTDLQNTMVMYQEYAPKVTAWISKVLNIQFHPSQDLLFILRSGDIFCRLACAMYKKVDCHLLGKGLEYGIHKIIFFLELCKSLHIKRSLLFQVSDLLVWPENDLNRKHALIVLRTVIALEKHARKSGWDGPVMGLKPVATVSLGVSSRDTMMLINNSSISSEMAPPVPSVSPEKLSKLVQLPSQTTNTNLSRTPSLSDSGIDSHSSGTGLATKSSREFPSQPSNDAGNSELAPTPSRFKLEPAPTKTSRFKLEPAIDIGMDSFSKPLQLQNDLASELSSELLPVQEAKRMPPILPPIEQHEAYHFQDSSDEEDFAGPERNSATSHSENMMAALTFNEIAENDVDVDSKVNVKEDTRKKMLADAIDKRLEMREKAVREFVEAEETYVTNLSNVVDYLNKIMKQRKRKSASMPDLTDGEKKSLKVPQNLNLSGIASHGPLPNESERAYKFRLETEVEELNRLYTVIEGMLSHHIQFLDRLQTCWDEKSNCMIIGEAISQFASSIQNSYTTYAVVALSGVQKSHLTLHTRGDMEKSEFVNRIVNKYVVSSLESGDAEEPSEQDWQWYLKRPIHRLSNYPKMLAAIHGENKIKLHPLVDADNKKLRICSIKLECISEAIGDHLDPKNK